MDTSIENANKLLQEYTNTRLKIVKFVGERLDKYFYQLSNHTQVVFCYDGTELVTILRQKDAARPYTYLCNGQAGTNCIELYHY